MTDTEKIAALEARLRESYTERDAALRKVKAHEEALRLIEGMDARVAKERDELRAEVKRLREALKIADGYMPAMNPKDQSAYDDLKGSGT